MGILTKINIDGNNLKYLKKNALNWLPYTHVSIMGNAM